MSTPRKDLRLKLNDDVHAALKAICAADGVDLRVFAERLIEAEVRERVRLVTVASTALQRTGIAARLLGTAGSCRE
jgi:hypothetical protein